MLKQSQKDDFELKDLQEKNKELKTKKENL